MLNTLDLLEIEPVPFIEDALGRKVNPDLPTDPYARVKYRDLEKVWTKIYDVANNECLGITVAEQWHPSFLGALGYAWLASSSLYDAFSRLERYGHMICKRLYIGIEASEKQVAVIFERETIQPDLHFLTDGMMTVFLGMCRANAGRGLCPTSAEFRRPAPDCVKEFQDYFGCPLQFESTDNRLTFSNQSIMEHLASSDPVVAEASDHIVIDYLSRMDDANIVDRVKAEIIKQLASGTMTDESIANALHKSTRTMQRELRDEGTTFSTVVNEVRHDLAIKYVQDSRLSLTEVAFMLGFSESSSFTRAFKRWTGSAPSNYKV